MGIREIEKKLETEDEKERIEEALRKKKATTQALAGRWQLLQVFIGVGIVILLISFAYVTSWLSCMAGDGQLRGMACYHLKVLGVCEQNGQYMTGTAFYKSNDGLYYQLGDPLQKVWVREGGEFVETNQTIKDLEWQ
jgi:hypothetical protein